MNHFKEFIIMSMPTGCPDRLFGNRTCPLGQIGGNAVLSVAELKRHAMNGTMCLELIEWHGKSGDAIPERLRGIRKVIKANSVGLSLLNGDASPSELRIESAKLVDYDGSTLTVYQIGERKPTEQEQGLLDEWQKEKEEYQRENPYGDCYWKKKDFFEKSDYPYMSGFEMVRGKRFLSHNGQVLDKQVRGDAILRYKVHWS